MLRVMKKAVLLHPLSEGTRGRKKGRRKREFFESLRPAQDTGAVAKRRKGRNLYKRDTKEDIEAGPEIQNTDKRQQ